jgi:hypothetical protein
MNELYEPGKNVSEKNEDWPDVVAKSKRLGPYLPLPFLRRSTFFAKQSRCQRATYLYAKIIA